MDGLFCFFCNILVINQASTRIRTGDLLITNQLHYRYAMLASLPFPRAFAGGCVSSAETAVPTEVPNLFAGIFFFGEEHGGQIGAGSILTSPLPSANA